MSVVRCWTLRFGVFLDFAKLNRYWLIVGRRAGKFWNVGESVFMQDSYRKSNNKNRIRSLAVR